MQPYLRLDFRFIVVDAVRWLLTASATVSASSGKPTMMLERRRMSQRNPRYQTPGVGAALSWWRGCPSGVDQGGVKPGEVAAEPDTPHHAGDFLGVQVERGRRVQVHRRVGFGE
jgi:hypothetical protein